MEGEIKQTNSKVGQKSWLIRVTDQLKMFWQNLYYKIFSQALADRLSDLNLQSFELEDPEIKTVLALVGTEKIRDKLIADSAGGSKFDCHQQAHKLGRISYEVFQVKAFQNMDTSCHSGLIHGAMEAFLQERGTASLASDIKQLCDSAASAFGRFECLHGVGHGVLAYDDYDMPKALQTCHTLFDSYSQSSCFGGVFMENIIVAEGNGVVPAHQTKWVSPDPYFPCNGIDQESRIQTQCYMMQTSRMLDLYEHNFEKVAEVCQEAPLNMRPTCFQSMGRDASGQTLRDPAKTHQICQLAPPEYQHDCIRGALYVFIEFWGDQLTNQPQQFCQALDEQDKGYCYSLFGGRLPEIFGKSPEKIRQICQYAEPDYLDSCLKASGLN
ncbi:hypothetical protein HYS94_04660 [Candidatus Daviesbacteria bacterium]|nr:hypothetical protein [Candidatus Daviesbacteria bacterium]